MTYSPDWNYHIETMPVEQTKEVRLWLESSGRAPLKSPGVHAKSEKLAVSRILFLTPFG